MKERVYGSIYAGAVEYEKAEAAVPIQEMIDNLENLRDEEGVTHIVGLSGNYRGAKYVRLGEPEWGEED